jgi:vacuolar-type H+-ATPase subunit F/Vma7
MAGKGGKIEGSGRKPKADEEKTNTIFLTAIKELKDVNSDDEARIEIAKDLYNSQRGLIFIAEHLFGKPKDSLDVTTQGEKLNTIIQLGSGIKPNEATD